jgi:hypothetical protein
MAIGINLNDDGDYYPLSEEEKELRSLEEAVMEQVKIHKEKHGTACQTERIHRN